jgi:Flp pilus assembly protein TadD
MGCVAPAKAFAGLQSGPRLVVLAGCTMMLGACAQSEKPSLSELLSQNEATTRAAETQASEPQATEREPAQPDKSDLAKATEYWGKAYAKNPRSLEAALNYAKDLKAMGEKKRALAVLQQASLVHGNSRELAGEYGRLALEFDQISLADRLLAAADDPVNPDWRVISARGTVLAKQGKYQEAIPFFERALTFAHDHPSILSNLALAHAMNGEPKRAEVLLRQAAAADRNSLKIRQNLALVLGLQGKYDEAKLLASRDLPAESAEQDASYLRRIVRLEPDKPSIAQAPDDVALDQPAPQPRIAPVHSAPKTKKNVAKKSVPLLTSSNRPNESSSNTATKTASLLRGTMMMAIPAQSERSQPAKKARAQKEMARKDANGQARAAEAKPVPDTEAAFSVAQWVPQTTPADFEDGPAVKSPAPASQGDQEARQQARNAWAPTSRVEQ